MRRRLAIVLLAAGTVIGYGSGIVHVLHRHGHGACSHWHERSYAGPPCHHGQDSDPGR